MLEESVRRGLPIEVVGPYLAEADYLERAPARGPPAGGRVRPVGPPAARPGPHRGAVVVKPSIKSLTRTGSKKLVATLPRLPAGEGADVGLLLEGTYPFVSGRRVELGARDHLRPARADLRRRVHRIVARGLLAHPLHAAPQPGARRDPLPGRAALAPPEGQLAQEQGPELRAARPPARRAPRSGGGPSRTASGRRWRRSRPPDGIGWRDFLHSDETWHQICASYHRFCTSPSFVDYFWTVRTMHGPLFKMAEIAARMPPFKVLHSVSTGYAGFLGSLLQHRRQCPYVLTEHGIYTKERKIDLAHADWIKDAAEELRSGLEEDRTYVRRLWLRFFESIGRLAYAAADPIIALYEGNRAPPDQRRRRPRPHPGDPQRHRPRALLRRPPAGRATGSAAGDRPDRAGGADQGRARLHPGHAHGGGGHARGGGLDRGTGGRGPGLRPRVPRAGGQRWAWGAR